MNQIISDPETWQNTLMYSLTGVVLVCLKEKIGRQNPENIFGRLPEQVVNRLKTEIRARHNEVIGYNEQLEQAIKQAEISTG
jgi:hypothetical protein